MSVPSQDYDVYEQRDAEDLPETSRLAVASLACGVLGPVFAGIPSVIGLFLGIAALRKIDRSGGRLGGRGKAIAGIWTGAVGLILFVVAAFLLLGMLERRRESQRLFAGINNIQVVARASWDYMAEHEGRFPPADSWSDVLRERLCCDELLQDPLLPGARSAFGYNRNLSGLTLEAITDPARTIVFFETDGGWNVAGGREVMISKPRRWKYLVLLASQEARQVNEEELGTLYWTP